MKDGGNIMNKFLKHKWIRWAGLGLAALIIASVGVAAGTGLVFAQSASPTPNPPQQSSPSNLRIAAIEKAFSAENTRLNTQAANLDKADQLIAKAQAHIDQAKANGKNVNLLQAALNVFKAQIANAKSLHNTASRILTAHAGFDENGKVAVRAGIGKIYRMYLAVFAVQTVRDAHQALNDARQVMRQAVRDLRSVIRLYRNAGPNNSNPTPTPAPSGSGA